MTRTRTTVRERDRLRLRSRSRNRGSLPAHRAVSPMAPINRLGTGSLDRAGAVGSAARSRRLSCPKSSRFRLRSAET